LIYNLAVTALVAETYPEQIGTKAEAESQPQRNKSTPTGESPYMCGTCPGPELTALREHGA